MKKAERKKGSQRGALPNKPTDFQVRAHIHEGRKLVGSGLNPVTKVICGTEVQETSTQKGTNSPDFNDVIFFNFRCRPDEMFDKLVDIKVLNAKKVLRDSLIGSFKFDLGMVYDETDHCFIHKWLLLTDPEDSAGGAKVCRVWCLQTVSSVCRISFGGKMGVEFNFNCHDLRVLSPTMQCVTLLTSLSTCIFT